MIALSVAARRDGAAAEGALMCSGGFAKRTFPRETPGVKLREDSAVSRVDVKG